MIEMNKNR